MTSRLRVALFTPFSPSTGGGGAILQSLAPLLRDREIDIDWLYTAQAPVNPNDRDWLGPGFSGGPITSDLWTNILLWSNRPTDRFNHLVSQLLQINADVYWVIAHNEGALVAKALTEMNRPVHITVHDDVPDGMYLRSRRYRFLAPLVRPRYHNILQRAQSLDVICENMRDHYKQLLGVESIVVHRCIAPAAAALPTQPLDEEVLTVGHIGALYRADEWRYFLTCLRTYAAKRGIKARMVMFGISGKHRDTAVREFGDLVSPLDNTPEDQAVAALAACDFVYAMYPFDKRSEVFCRTSLPTKFSSYVMSRRPIFSHAPLGSSMDWILKRHNIGRLLPQQKPAQDVFDQVVDELRNIQVVPANYQSVTDDLFGMANVDRMERALRSVAANHGH